MGLSSSKTTSGPSKAAMPYLKQGSSALQDAFSQSQQLGGQVTSALGDTFKNYSTTNPNLTAANGYVGDVLGGKFMQGNPFLENIIGSTNNDVMDRVNSAFSRAGQTGSSRQIGELGKQLSSAENNLRYQNYSDEQARMAQAVQQAAGLNSAQNENIQTQAGLGQTLSGIPLDLASQYASGLGGLWGNSVTQKTSGSLASGLGGLLSSVAGVKKAFS